jgi:hypothetical protein
MSWEKPNLLPIWEAQVCGSIRKFESRNVISADRFTRKFGDFFNGAQVGQRSSGAATESF